MAKLMGGFRVAFDGASICVESDIPEVIDFVAETYFHMEANSEELVATIRLARSPNGYMLTLPDGVQIEQVSYDFLLLLIRDEIRIRFMMVRPAYLWLHAACVEKNGDATLLCGSSGQGKS